MSDNDDQIDLDAPIASDKLVQAAEAQPAPADVRDDIEIVPAPEPVKPNYTISVKWSDKLAALNPNYERLTMPSGTAKVMLDSVDKLSGQISGLDAQSQKWAMTVGDAFGGLPHAKRLERTAAREGAHWKQSVTSAERELKAGTPSFKHSADTQYTGDRARLLARSVLRLGTVFQVPLWHSGFWVTLRTPTEGELLDLERRALQQRGILGRQTYGLLFSNSMAYTNEIFLDFILDHVYNTSINIKDDQELRKHIRLPDLSILIWALACATWPNGFQYERPCVADPDTCRHIIHEKLNLSVLQWTDETQLTPAQIKHMTSRATHSMSIEGVQSYVDGFIIGQNQQVDLAEDLKVVFRVPLAQEHIDSGARWIKTIEETYGRAMTEEPQARDAFLANQARATALREYAHCVHALKIKDLEVEDVGTIEDILNDLTARDDIRTAFMKAAGNYLDDSLISFIGIPSYECPSCGRPQPMSENSRFPEIIPLDVTNSFFRLLVQRTTKIQDRILAPTWGTEISD